MSFEKTFGLTAMASLAMSCFAALGASGDSSSSTQAVQSVQASVPATVIRTNQNGRVRPEQLPVTPISSLTPAMSASRSTRTVRVQGTVVNQALGEYVMIQDETGSIRAETRQTLPIGSGERVTAWGRLFWNGNQPCLSNAVVSPLAWDSIAQQRIVPAPGKPEQLPVLTQVRQIRELSSAQAAWNYPVRVRGVITTLWRDYRALFVQDETAGIFVSVPNLPRDATWAVGDQVEVEGVSGPGGYAPVIDSAAIKVLGAGTLPEARPATLYQMAMGQFDSQWIEVRGVVRSTRINRRSTDLLLSDVNGLVEVNVPGGEALTNLVNSLVRVRGVCASRANPIRQLIGVYVWSPSTDLVVVEEKAVADPFALPTQTIGSLSEFNEQRASQHQLKIAGVVTYSQSGRLLFVQDETGGVPVYLAQPADFNPGDRVEVAGIISPGDFGYVFRNATCRLVGHADIPIAKTVLPVSVLNQNLHGRWVQLDARLVSCSRRDTDYVITLQSDTAVFEAIRPLAANAIAANWLPRPGSLVRFHGVYSILGDDSRQPRAFRLYVPPAEPIETLDQATWWSLQHTAIALAIMTIAVLAGVLWVITLRRKIRQQTATLQQSELKFRSLVEQSLVGVYIIQNDRFAYVNPRFAEIYGYAPEEMIQKIRVEDVVFEEDLPLVQEQIRRRVTGEVATIHYLCRARRKDGSVIFVEALGNRAEYGGKVAIVGTLLDITERKRAEVALAEASSLLETMLENSPDHIYFKDRESRFVRYSRSFADLLHLSDPRSLTGKTDFDLFTEEHARPAYEDEQQIIRSGQPIVGKLERETHKDGRTTWALTTKLPWRDKDGNIIGTFGTSKDVTVIKEVEEKLAYEQEFFRVLSGNLPDNIYFKDRESRFVRVSHSKAKSTLAHARDRYLATHPEAANGELPPHLDDVDAFTKYLIGKTDFETYEDKFAQRAFDQEQNIIRTGIPVIGKLEHMSFPDGPDRWMLITKMPWHDKEGNIVGTFGISKDVTALKEAEEKLSYERELFRALVETLPDAIYFKDRESRFVRLSKSKVERSRQVLLKRHRAENPALDTGRLPVYLTDIAKCAEYLEGKTDFDVYTEDRARLAYTEEQQIISTGQPLIGKLEQSKLNDGKSAWYLTTKMPWRDQNGNVIGTFGVSREITALKEAENQLDAAHKRIVETSRLAGMAEVATDVLHNVGNVLNSVNVTCSLSIDRIKASKISSLSKVSALLEENRDRLTEFFTRDSRGQQLPSYVAALADHLKGEQTVLAKELEQLLKHIDHIKQIVAMQQSYAKVAGVMEEISATQLVEDALHINAAALTRHDVHVRREFSETPTIVTEKHKVLQILVNLIRNAKYAMDEARRQDKILTVKVDSDGNGTVKIQVADNGVGIPKENLTRIFGHGFTTRRDGHGFGLHSSALAVRELGGSLHAHSDGPGAGATFTLSLPHQPPEQTQSLV